MPTKLTVIFLCIVNYSFSQVKPQPTRFDRFVHRSGIEWAAYASDTFSFGGFNTLLLNRLEKKQIKASLPVDSRTAAANDIKYVSLDSINRVFFDDGENKIDTATFKVTEITQILYIKDGKLRSYIPWVTPMVPTYISNGTYIGERFYFNTAYNYRYDFRHRKRHKPVFLGSTAKMVKLDDPANKLKEMYGQNLLAASWSYIPGSATTVFSADGVHKLDPNSIDITGEKKQMQPVPIYDSTSGSTKIKYMVAEGAAVAGTYTHVQLLQDWYYNRKKNILFSYVREMHVYITRENKDLLPVFKVVFN